MFLLILDRELGVLNKKTCLLVTFTFNVPYFLSIILKTTTQEKLKTIFKVLNHKISKQLSRIILLHVKIFRFFPPNILKLIIVLFYVSVFEYKLSKGFSLFLPIHNTYCGPILPPRIMF